MYNPFTFGSIIGSQGLVDRQAELKTVEQALQAGGKLFLIGPRRYGKSSLLQAARENLTARGLAVLHLNAEAYSDLDTLSRAIVEESARVTQGPLQAVGEKIRDLFAHLKPELSYNITTGTWKASLGLTKPEDPAANLIETLHGLESLAKSENRFLGLALDEFQRVIELGGAPTEAQIRAAIQTHSRVGYVFAGSKTRLLTDMVTNAERPFYRLGQTLFLQEIPRPFFREFLHASFKAGKLKIDNEAVETILDLAADVPYNVQLLAHTTWNQAAGGKSVSAPDVQAALRGLLAQNDPFYSQLWTTLTPIQGRTLQWLLQSEGHHLLGAEASRRIGKNPASIQRALGALQDKDVIRLETRQGKAAYRLEDPFFGAWIEQAIVEL